MTTRRTFLCGLCGLAVWAGVAEAQEPMSLAPPGQSQPFDASNDATITAPSMHEPADLRDLVFFAGGAIELRVPLNWQVREWPRAREMRLLVSPGEFSGGLQPPHDGIWLSVLAQPTAQPLSPEQLADYVARRCRNGAEDRTTLQQTDWIQLAGQRAWRQTFAVDVPEAGGTGESLRVVAAHWAIPMPWGIVELQARAPEPLGSQRFADWDLLLESLVLRAPEMNRSPAVANVAEAEPILGSWRSFRGTMRLHPDGRIVIASDPDRFARLDDESRPRPKAISGHFESRQDLLLVQWDDGSKLNFRWRLADGRLLLTDHEGKTSQLRRIWE